MARREDPKASARREQPAMSGVGERQDELEGLDYQDEGGWLPAFSSLLRFLNVAGCNEYITPIAREAAARADWPTPQIEMAVLNKALAFLGRIENHPPAHLTVAQREELSTLRHKAVLLAMYRLRVLARETEHLDKVAARVATHIKKPRPNEIEFMGERQYRVGDGRPIAVTDREDCVLQAFLKYPAMNERKLVATSGIEQAVKVLRLLRTKYDQAFEPFISLPGGKGMGGYLVAIRRTANDQQMTSIRPALPPRAPR
jgi:hypothetical protein